MNEEEEYELRRLQLKKESEDLLTKYKEFEPTPHNSKELAELIKALDIVQKKYEDLVDELDIEIVLAKVDEQLENEGYFDKKKI